MANSGDFLAKIKLALEGKDAVVTGLQQTQQAAQKLSGTRVTTLFDKEGLVTGKQIEEQFKTIKPVVDKAGTGMKDFGNAMKRALIVAPVWLALRAGMQFFIQGIQEGIDYLIQFEKQMILVEQTLRAFGGTTDSINDLRDRFSSLSKETGQSTAAIAKNYLEIVKASGSYAGAADTVKTAVLAQEVAQSDSLDITRALALAIKLQGDSFGKTTSQQEKYKEVASTLYILAAKNLVSFADLAKEYNSFVPIGEAANLTFQETAAILATLNSAGVQNVQGLKTALLRTLADSEKIGKELGIAITPDTKPIDLFMSVINKFKAAMKGGVDLKAFGALGEVFGKGGRGGSVIIKTLSDTVEQLNKNLAATKFPTQNAREFDESLKEIQDSLPHQIELFQNLKKQAFETFVIGLTGGRDFADSMKNINDFMEQAIRVAGNLGAELNFIATLHIPILDVLNFQNELMKAQVKQLKDQSDLHERIQSALKGESSLQETIAILAEAKTSKLITDEKLRVRVVEQLQTEANLLAKNGKLEGQKREEAEKTVITLQKQQKELDKQRDRLTDLVFQYEKADMFERERIRRQLELQAQTPEQIVNAYQGSNYDKNIIIENISSFTKEVREALAASIATQRGLTPYTETIAPIAPAIAQQINYSGSMIFYSINPDIIDKLAKLTPEEVIEYITTHPEAKQLIANIAANTNTK